MIAVIQRVTKGKVLLDGQVYSQTGKGYVILVGFCEEDTENDAIKMAEKIANAGLHLSKLKIPMMLKNFMNF